MSQSLQAQRRAMITQIKSDIAYWERQLAEAPRSQRIKSKLAGCKRLLAEVESDIKSKE